MNKKEKPIFFDERNKKIIELYKNLHGFTTSCDAILDLLKDNDKWSKVCEMYKSVHPEPLPKELKVSKKIIDLDKSVEEILNG